MKRVSVMPPSEEKPTLPPALEKSAEDASEKPNILFILADDMGAWALGCAGNRDVRTPHLDRLAAEGVRFENFYCASPVCSPARASLMTGMMPSAHGVYDWLKSGSLCRADLGNLADHPVFAAEKEAIQYLDRFECYSDLLCRAGYECHLSGKWHLGDSLRPQHGFSHWFTIGRGGCLYTSPDIVREGKVSIEQGYLTDMITEDALSVLEQASSRSAPFYLSVHYTAPHTPWEQSEHPAEIWNLYEGCTFEETPALPVHPQQIHSCDRPFEPGPELRRRAEAGDEEGKQAVARFEEDRRRLLRGYYTAITAMDRGIGRILHKLDELGLREKTLICFMADNGMNLGQHGIWGKGNGTFPLNLYESSCKVPCLFRWPGKIPAGGVISRVCSQLDFFPTVAALCGAAPRSDGRYRPGENLLPLLLTAQDEHAAGGGDEEGQAFVVDEYGPNRMLRDGRYKIVRRYPYGPDELFDLKQDPNEEHNLYYDESLLDLRCRLEQELHAWWDLYTDPSMDGCREAVTGGGQLGRGGKDKIGRIYEAQDEVGKSRRNLPPPSPER